MTEQSPPPQPNRSFSVGPVAVEIYPDSARLGQAAAAFVAAQIRRVLSQREQANVIFATGASQYDFLAALLPEDVDWPRVNAFHLDEYLGLPADHPASFRRYLQERLFQHLPFRSVHLLDGNAANPVVEAARYSGLLAAHPADVACIGIGENGHLAFNDPPADFETEALVHVVDLDEACRQQQVGEGHFATVADVPAQALSLSIPAILAASVISCAVPDARKAPAVQCTLEGPISPDCPASALRGHDNCRLFLDEASASRLGG